MPTTPRLIAFVGVGGTCADDSSLNIDWARPGWADANGPGRAQGWAGVVSRCVRPLLDAGVRAIWLDEPGGVLSNEAFMFSQMSLAPSWLRQDFRQAWQAVTHTMEVIAYIGWAERDPLLRRDATDGPRPFGFRVSDSTDLLTASGMSIAIDSAGGSSPGSLGQLAACQLANAGTRVYVEAPWRERPRCAWADSFPIVSDDNVKGNDEPAQSVADRLRSPLGAEMVAHVKSVPHPDAPTAADKQALAARCKALRDAGVSPCVDGAWLWKGEISVKELGF